MEKILSVIVPVYNVEKYICKCLDSLLVSDNLLSLLDVVIINDGTPDKSAELARVYENKYQGVFRVIDQENRGHGGAWNHGTELAVGKYLFYLDSDDWVDTVEFSKLLVFLKNNDTDLVLLDRKKYYAQTNSFEDIKIYGIEPNKIYNANTFNWLNCADVAHVAYAHSTVYKTKMMQKYMPLFCEHVMYDDVSLQVIPISIADTFIYKNYDVYRYYIGRLGQSFDPKVRAKHLDNVTTVIKFVLSWMKRYDHVVSNNTTKRLWFDDLWNSLAPYHYRELIKLPYKQAKTKIKEWNVFVKKELPINNDSKEIKDYNKLPFLIFFSKYRSIKAMEKIVNRLKRWGNSKH